MSLKSILVSASLLLLLGAGQGASEDQSAKGKGFSKETVSIIKQRLGIGNRKAGEEIYPDEYGLTQSQGKGKDQGKGEGKRKSAKSGGRGQGLPPGLAKRNALPPGLAKMQTLPPGLSKSPLPLSLEQALGPPPFGAERFLVGGQNVVLVEKGSGRVLDIIVGKVDQKKLGAERRVSERLRHKGRAAAGGGAPDRPLVTGQVPNADEPASDVDHVIRKKPGRTTYDPGATPDEQEEKEDKGKGRKKK
ncbi:MAG: hypothetical protein IIC07_01780 [Proteobacteria bacterium]|nr:hypothetical protein [Pseudomonadota bacterium]